jgi:hypothetical protein
MDDITKRIEDVEREFGQMKAQRDRKLDELHTLAHVRQTLLVSDIPLVALTLKNMAKSKPFVVSDPEVTHWMAVHHDELMVFWEIMGEYPKRLAAHRAAKENKRLNLKAKERITNDH